MEGRGDALYGTTGCPGFVHNQRDIVLLGKCIKIALNVMYWNNLDKIGLPFVGLLLF